MKYQKYLLVIGITLFAYLIFKTDPKTIWEAFRTINIRILVFIVPLLIIDALIKGTKWKLVINAHAMDYPLVESIKVFMIGVFFGLVTPGRAGDIIRANFLQKHHKSYSNSLSTVIVDRFIDIGTLAVLGSLSLFLFSYVYGSTGVSYILLVILVVGYFGVLAALASKRLTMFFLERMGRQFLIDFYMNLRQLEKKKLVASTLLGFIAWIVTPLEAFVIAQSMGLNLSFVFIFLCIPIITLAEIIPVTISGLGTREAAYIALFGLIAISAPTAIAFSLAYLVFTFWTPALLGLLFWFQKEYFTKKTV